MKTAGKSQPKQPSALQKEAKYLKKRMLISRVIGILACILSLTGIVVYYLSLINEWLCIILIAYCLGNIFTSNSFIQDMKVGNPWHRVNGVCSIIFYILTVALIIYGFVTHNLSLQFK